MLVCFFFVLIVPIFQRTRRPSSLPPLLLPWLLRTGQELLLRLLEAVEVPEQGIEAEVLVDLIEEGAIQTEDVAEVSLSLDSITTQPIQITEDALQYWRTQLREILLHLHIVDVGHLQFLLLDPPPPSKTRQSGPAPSRSRVRVILMVKKRLLTTEATAGVTAAVRITSTAINWSANFIIILDRRGHWANACPF